MRKVILARKEKAPRKVKFLAEIDRHICWPDLAQLAEPCIEEAKDATVTKASLEALVRIAILDRCFGLTREELLTMEPTSSTAPISANEKSVPSHEEVESFFQIIARCKSRGHIMQELDRQLARVGISRGRTLSIV
jgi:hypothetical protein